MKSEHATEGYEASDAAAGPVFVYGLVLALLTACALAASAWLSQEVTEEIRSTERVSPVEGLRKGPEGPELQAVLARELERHREWEERMLGATEWVDPVNRVVRIPIERALELTLEEGLPARKSAGAESQERGDGR